MGEIFQILAGRSLGAGVYVAKLCATKLRGVLNPIGMSFDQVSHGPPTAGFHALRGLPLPHIKVLPINGGGEPAILENR